MEIANISGTEHVTHLELNAINNRFQNGSINSAVVWTHIMTNPSTCDPLMNFNTFSHEMRSPSCAAHQLERCPSIIITGFPTRAHLLVFDKHSLFSKHSVWVVGCEAHINWTSLKYLVLRSLHSSSSRFISIHAIVITDIFILRYLHWASFYPYILAFTTQW